MRTRSYKDLQVWQRCIELVLEMYKLTDHFPKSETYGLASQMRRSAVSIPSNIAEGYKRGNLGEYIQFLCFADASAAELETQLIIAKKLYGQLDFSKVEPLLMEIQKMLAVMIKRLRANRWTLYATQAQPARRRLRVAFWLLRLHLLALFL
ncbi:four helix bundle protein [Candidatus Microgenomates bacterium]|nr:four helix bundle protein [Candidatus Microgenomates bacterium]